MGILGNSGYAWNRDPRTKHRRAHLCRGGVRLCDLRPVRKKHDLSLPADDVYDMPAMPVCDRCFSIRAERRNALR